MKHDFLAKSVLLPSLSTVEYSSAYLLSYWMICKYASVNTRKSRASIQEKLYKKRDEDGASFQSSPKIHRMLITRLISDSFAYRQSLQRPTS